MLKRIILTGLKKKKIGLDVCGEVICRLLLTLLKVPGAGTGLFSQTCLCSPAGCFTVHQVVGPWDGSQSWV